MGLAASLNRGIALSNGWILREKEIVKFFKKNL